MQDKRFADVKWRLNNLYKIIDAQGNEIDFKMNAAQERLFDEMHYFNAILKARQLGFTTFIDLYLLDSCIFKPNHSCGIIAQGLSEVEDIFRTKIKFAYDNLPQWLRDKVVATSDSARRLQFSNGSSIVVGTSLRGGTFQKLHVSEYGKIAARYPEKAREIKTGALNTVHAGQQIFVESTAEGQQGEFFELIERAKRLKAEGTELSVLDPKLHFFPWYENPNYTLGEKDIKNTSINMNMVGYFQKLSVELTPGQKAWYVKKDEQQGDDMKREFPSTPEEAFEQSMEGAIYQKQMLLVREKGQIGYYPHEPSQPVYTWWDLGGYTSVWFFQHIGNEYRFIDYHESHNEGWDYYAKMLQSKPYVYKEHALPWDGESVTVGKQVSTVKKDLEDLGVRPIRIVIKTKNKWVDITGACRSVLPRCFFDEQHCSVGIKHLDNYRREWNDKLGVWKEEPRHDDASHAADAYRTFAMGFVERQEEISYYVEEQEYASDYDPLNY